MFVLQLGAEHLPAFQTHMVDGEVAQVSNVHHFPDGEVKAIGRRIFAQHDLLRAERDIHRHVIHHRAIRIDLKRMLQPRRLNHQTVFLARFQQPFENIDRPDELRAVAGGRMLINLFRLANLYELTAVHDRNTPGHGHRLFLVVGNHHAGHPHALKDIHHFQLHTVTQFFIQGTHRFIEEQQLWPFRQASGQRHALTLATRELMRFTLRELLHVHQAEHLRHAGGDFGFRQFVLLKTKGDILLHRHMGEERVRLEHHVYRALIRRHAGKIDTIQHDLPGGRLFKTGQHTQQGRFTAARCAQKGKNFTFVDSQADVVHGMLTIERFGEVTNFKKRGQRFTDFRLRAGDRVIHGVLSGRNQNWCKRTIRVRIVGRRSRQRD
ncbi:hypothetical protein EcWSU1_01416 [Enterobacter ludwigii]|uniref:Uncharacterized protein n=1 Tax=Enterobacter ludwigii TaxID=299767 RepID=G8LGT1_9ENTR|nr:hypothetical protein EcWSU1_01416 [Enterobacter ludwigii]